MKGTDSIRTHCGQFCLFTNSKRRGIVIIVQFHGLSPAEKGQDQNVLNVQLGEVEVWRPSGHNWMSGEQGISGEVFLSRAGFNL